MVKIKIAYEGDLRCRLVHGPSAAVLSTDTPKDNEGKGESFSPTDLVASSLGACMLTIMGIYAKRHGIKLKGTTAEITKEMVSDPDRRIGRITVKVSMAAGIEPTRRASLEKAALTCPVNLSLHPNIDRPVSFHYPD